MVVGRAMMDIRLFGARSLKDKRRVVESLLVRLRQRYGISCAEVGENDTWGRALIGLACVASEGWHAEEVLRKALLFVENNIDGEVLHFELDIIT